MGHFTEQEITYLRSQRLGRLATVNANGEPHLTAVGFDYHAELDTIDIGGSSGGFGTSKKYRDVQANDKVAFIVDDVHIGEDAKRSMLRGIEIRGRAQAYATGGEQLGERFDPAFIRIFPTRIVSWGINEAGYKLDSRNVT